MLHDYCLRVLSNGETPMEFHTFTDTECMLNAIVTGVKTKRPNSIRAALYLLEVLCVSSKELSKKQKVELFDHFTNYVFDNFRKPTAMALLKYAIAHRKVKTEVTSPSWDIISTLFTPVYLTDKCDPSVKMEFHQFQRVYDKLATMDGVSDQLRENVLLIV